MIQLYFADIPVYRLPEEQYRDAMEKYIDEMMYGTDPELRQRRKGFYERNPNNKIHFVDSLKRQYGGAWRFNEIVGYIRLFFLGTQIRGELWMVDMQRICRTRKKLLVFHTLKVVPEMGIPSGATSVEIWMILLQYLDEARKKLKPRVVDSSMFEVLGPSVDWANLLGRVWPKPIQRGLETPPYTKT